MYVHTCLWACSCAHYNNIVFIIPIDDTAIIQIVFIKDDLLETNTAKS